MFNRKRQGRGLRDGMSSVLMIVARLRYLVLTLAAVVVIAGVDTAPPATRSEAADDDLASARLLCTMGVGGER
jgi:hypothetical protein